MPRIFKYLEVDCLQVNLVCTSAQINLLKYTILYYYYYLLLLFFSGNINNNIIIILFYFQFKKDIDS